MSFTDDFEAFFGKPAPERPQKPEPKVVTPPKRRGRPTKAEAIERALNAAPKKPKPVSKAEAAEILDEEEDDRAEAADDYAAYYKPVNVEFLRKVFRMDRATVKQRLGPPGKTGSCPVVQWVPGTRGPSPQYDFVTAVSFLSRPKQDIAEYIRSMRTQDLPIHISKEFWSAERMRQIVSENAGDLWRTADVQEALGAVFKTCKESMRLWVEDIRMKHELPPEVRTRLSELVDQLQLEMQRAVIESAKERKTPSQMAEVDAVMNEANFTKLGHKTGPKGDKGEGNV